MQRAQVARFPGFGIVYPDGINGIKVVKTFVQGPKKMVQPDGNVEWTTPPPTIHELYGGGFVYASGEPVTDRVHLESITDMKMRDKALRWFDGDKSISELATQNVPPLKVQNTVRRRGRNHCMLYLRIWIKVDLQRKCLRFLSRMHCLRFFLPSLVLLRQ